MPDRYRALLIGNGRYPEDPHNLTPLEGPVNDVTLLRGALADPRVGLFAQDDVTVRLEMTSYELLNALDGFFGSAQRDDVLLLYYSGHGRLDHTNTLFLCARDTMVDRIRATAITSRRLDEFIDASAAARVVLILDCCHSGAFKGGDFAQPLSGVGRYVLASCRARELANDASAANRASLFTHHVVQGLLGAAAGPGLPDHLTIEELHGYVRDRLAEEGRQRPQFSGRGDGGLAIARRVESDPQPAPAAAEQDGAESADAAGTAGRPGVVAPRQLPPAADLFVDRDQHADRLVQILLRADADPVVGAGATWSGPPVAVLSGLGGVGKTSLAVEVAHRVSGRFPDGQFFADLRGADGAPLRPITVQGEFLRALGVPNVPDSEDEQTRLYRSALAGGRYLLVLDNAHSEDQVRRLIPGASRCAVLVTSRNSLPLLDTPHTFTLAALSTEDGIRLIGAVVGADRAADQAGPLDRIATACGGFPLALRIAAARLAGRPGWQFARLAGRLDDEGQRLRELRMGDVEARAGFIFSYQHLDAQGQRLYRLLGVANLSDFPLWVPAALLDVSPTEAEGHLDRLVDANLLAAGSDVPRYQLHDLLRVFARERAEEEAAPERFAALERLCAAAFALADASDRRLSAGNSATWDRPLDWSLSIPAAELVATAAPGPAWFGLERANLLAMMELAHRSGHRPWVWRLAGAMWQYLEYSSRWGDWRAAFELALRSAREEGDARAESSSLRLLGVLSRSLGHTGPADALFAAALDRLTGLDEAFERSMVLKDLSVTARLNNRHAESVRLLLAAIAGYESLGREFWVAASLRELGIEYRFLGEWDNAREAFSRSIAAFARVGEESQEAGTWLQLGVLERLLGNGNAATASLQRAGVVFERLGRQHALLDVTRELGVLRREQGELDVAIGIFADCIARWREIDNPRELAATLHDASVTELRRGDAAAARDNAAAALGIFDGLGDRLAATRVRVTLAQIDLLGGSPDRALPRLDAELLVLRELSDPVWEVKTLRLRADALASLGRDGASAAARSESDRIAVGLTLADEDRA